MKKIIQTLLKSLLVALVYVFTLVLGGIIVSAVGIKLPATRDAIEALVSSFAGGVIIGLCIGPIASLLPAGKARHLVVWSSLIFLNLTSVAIEGYFFEPDVVGNSLPGLIVQLFLASLGTGWIITAIFAPKGPVTTATAIRRSGVEWMWRFLVSPLVYVFFYFIFGMINYALVTKPYYATHVGGLAVPALTVTLTAEIIRGVLITLSVLPFILTIQGDKWRIALQTGFILFAIGGLVPLTMQVGSLPLFLLAASAVEIFFQNFSTGVLISRLMSLDITKGTQIGQPEVKSQI